jgi:uncharacterized protein
MGRAAPPAPVERTSDFAATEQIRAGLALPDAYPHQPATVEVRETHISWVFLAGERAYKLKKPLILDFLDYGTPARRREMCREEVRLNRRLAPDVYLGVRGVALTAAGVELTAEEDPQALDYLVEMRRYDERRTLAALLDRGELEPRHVKAAGATLARFHAQARPAPIAPKPEVEAERRCERNAHELLTYLERPEDISRIQALERFAHAFITVHRAVFHARAGQRRVREGHGDLRAEHVLLDSDVEIVDCVEFDPQLRELDVADDLAFLVADLAARSGADRFGAALIDAYRETGGDPGDDALIAFYAVYRLLVRAKVALVRAGELPPGSGEREHECAHARELIGLAERFAWRARLPLVIMVCGAPASGKTHLAGALASRSSLPHLSSDLIRKELRGLRTGERASPETYTREWNVRTYAELGRRAADAVATSGGAIADATFRHRADRRAFAATFGETARSLFIECQAPRAVIGERATRRQRDPEHVSDAGAAIALREQDSWEPLDEVAPDLHLILRTDRPLEAILDDVQALLDQRVLAAPRVAT